jgi:hypothetical protein
MPFRILAQPSFVLASPGGALSSERFAALLTLLLPLSPKRRSVTRIVCHVIVAGGRAGFDAENTLATQHVDSDALLLGPLDDLRCPAHVVALLRTRDLRRFAFTQEIDDGFPIDVAIFIRNV